LLHARDFREPLHTRGATEYPFIEFEVALKELESTPVRATDDHTTLEVEGVRNTPWRESQICAARTLALEQANPLGRNDEASPSHAFCRRINRLIGHRRRC
jgi:hypothetical protein